MGRIIILHYKKTLVHFNAVSSIQTFVQKTNNYKLTFKIYHITHNKHIHYYVIIKLKTSVHQFTIIIIYIISYGRRPASVYDNIGRYPAGHRTTSFGARPALEEISRAPYSAGPILHG